MGNAKRADCKQKYVKVQLSVWCVCVGDKYQTEDIYTLKNMVAANLEQPHNFYCLSDRQRGDINCFIPDEKWPGWWAKLLLFRYAGGQVLYLDLDVVVTGPLDHLVSSKLSMPANWAESGHGGCQSSVMSWDASTCHYTHIADMFDPSLLGAPQTGGICPHYGRYGDQQLWGDQEFITYLMGDPGHSVIPMTNVYSYKYHCRQSLPSDASVVCFHGEPKPNQVSDAWVKKARLCM